MSTRQIVKVLSVLSRIQRTEAVVDVADSLEVEDSTSRVRVEALRRSSKRLSHTGRAQTGLVRVQPCEEVGHRQALTVDYSVPLCKISELFRGTIDWNPELQLTIHVFCLVACTLSTQHDRTGTIAKGDSCPSLTRNWVSGSSSARRELHSPADSIVSRDTSVLVVGRTRRRNCKARTGTSWRLIPCASRNELAVELSIEEAVVWEDTSKATSVEPPVIIDSATTSREAWEESKGSTSLSHITCT